MASSESQPQVINLATVPLPYLEQLHSQLHDECEFFGDSLQQLRGVQQKFSESRNAVEKLAATKAAAKTSGASKAILVPLSAAMYVNGELDESERVLVELGTGYYAEMAFPKALDYFTRKVEYVSKQLASVQEIFAEKTKMRSAIVDMMRLKTDPQFQRRAGVDPSASG